MKTVKKSQKTAAKPQGKAVKKPRQTRKEKRTARLKALDLSPGEAKEIIQAIRSGEVDALVVSTEEGDKVFTLTGADYPYRMMVEMLNEGAATLSPDGTIFYCNRRLAEMIGAPLEKIIGASIFGHIDPREEKAFRAYFRKGLKGTSRGESAFYTADGKLLPVLLSLSNIHLEDAPVSVSLVATDVRALREAQLDLQKARAELEVRVVERTEALRESEEKYRHLVEGSGSVIIRADKNLNITFMNRHGLEFFGFSEDEIIGRNAVGTIIPLKDEEGRDLAAMAEDLRLNPDDYSANVHQNRRKDGSLVWMSWANKMICNNRGEVMEILAIGNDLTTLKKVESQLVASRNQLQNIIDNTPALVYVFDLEERFLIANWAIAELFSTTPREVIGKRRRSFMSEDTAKRHEANDREVIRAGKAMEFEEHGEFGGRQITWLTAKFPLHNLAGRIYAVAGISTDITERKQIEDALKTYSNKLEEAYAEIESFSYSVSHDLRAPLRAIDGYARMLLKKHGEEFDEDSMRKFNVIRASAQQMGQLIDDILTLSRIGRYKASIVEIDMEGIIRDVWKELQIDIGGRNINLTVTAMPPAHGDRTLVKQAYSNLLGNAVKFTKHCNPARIEIGGRIEGNECIYYVKDNGVGFDMAYYDKLFGIFQRLHKADEFEGTGVGLA
ncbi:MAG TPA: PAS domain S-box protein, partial [Syntrophales bacterium]|nr:PAS domain S-box protein [Syntrophales bacterium]